MNVTVPADFVLDLDPVTIASLKAELAPPSKPPKRIDYLSDERCLVEVKDGVRCSKKINEGWLCSFHERYFLSPKPGEYVPPADEEILIGTLQRELRGLKIEKVLAYPHGVIGLRIGTEQEI